MVKPEENFHPGVMATTLLGPDLPEARGKTKIEKNIFLQNPEREPGAVLPEQQRATRRGASTALPTKQAEYSSAIL